MSENPLEYLRSGRGLSKAIASGRKSKKMTQQELADAVGLTREWISNLERSPDKAQAVSLGLAIRILMAVGYRIALDPVEGPKNIEQIERENHLKEAKGLDNVSTQGKTP